MGKVKPFHCFSMWVALVCMGSNTLFAQEQKNAFPDNVMSVECYGLPSATAWDMKRTYIASTPVFDMDVPLVGDVDGDGDVEALAAQTVEIINDCYYSKGIYIFNAKTGAVKRTLSNLPYFFPGSGTRAIADVNRDGVAELFIASGYGEANINEGYLYCYNLKTGLLNWKAPMPYTYRAPDRNGANILIHDFNHDGVPEVVVLDKIYNAQTGALLLDMNLEVSGLSFGYGSGHGVNFPRGTVHYFPAVADMNNDGTAELVAGKHIYSINITNTSNTTGNTWSILRTLNSARADVGDGATAVADLNLDGYLDVVVTRNSQGTPGTAYVFAWDGLTGNLLNSAQMLSLPDLAYHGPSIPFLGDLDGDGYPEIAFTTPSSLFAYKYNKATSTLDQFWNIATTDLSGATTLTMFDFNQDGKTELVYRDQDHLRIINGSKKSHITGKDTTVYNLSEFDCGSYTINEYPVIADVTGDGHADIITLGKEKFVANTTGYLFLFESNTPGSWAPARKIWNQYAYNSVNVNNNLTIPRYQFNPATKMDGLDGIMGTADDKRPFNAFLQQQTFISDDGVPYFMLPDLRQASLKPTCTYYGSGDSLRISIDVKNDGSAGIGAPVYCTAYSNTIASANVMAVGSYNGQIQPGETRTITFKVDGFKSKFPNSQEIIVRVNDNNMRYPYQQECDKSDSVQIKLVTEILMAQSDYTSTSVDVPVNVVVTANDNLGNCTPHTISINANPKKGSAAVLDNNTIRYTPANGFIGQDSLEYMLSCGGQNSVAKVYINVINLPDNFYESKCNYEAGSFAFSMVERYRSKETTSNYYPAVVGDLDKDGYSEIIIPSSSTTHPQQQVIYIYDYQAKLKKSFSLPATAAMHSNFNAMMIADLDGDGYGEIIIPTSGIAPYTLFVFDRNGVQKASITSPQIFGRTIGVADFDVDGTPEIYAGTSIYKYTGSALVQLYAGNTDMNTMAQDVTGDGMPELISINECYKVAINNKTGATGNSITKISSITLALSSATFEYSHGLADVDLDGVIEVVAITSDIANSQIIMNIWNPMSGALKYSYTISGICKSNHIRASWPFIGDTDSNGYPDIAFMGGGNQLGCTYIYRFEYNPGTKKVVLKKQDNTFQDYSSMCTGMSMFDFDNDGGNEIVYRDEIKLYILNGSDFSKKVEIPSCLSGTGWEYPVVASLTPSGESYVIMNSGDPGDAYHVGTLRIYGADVANGGTPWAPARKFWNQYAFFQNIMNSDLKIIKNPSPLSLELTSTDGKNRKLRPFNGMMVQLGPIETSTLEFVHPIADLGAYNLTYNYNVNTNKLELAFNLNNTGNAAMDPLIPVNVYAYKGGTATKIMTYNYDQAVNVGDVKSVSFAVDNFSSYIPHDSIVIKAGEGKLDCNPTNNNLKIVTYYNGGYNDYYGAYNSGSGANGTFGILANDAAGLPGVNSLNSFISSAGSTLSKVTGTPNQLGYVSPLNFIGTDTVRYSASGVVNNLPALVYATSYIYVYPGKVVDCPFTNKSIRINDTKNKVTVDYFTAATGGTNANTQSASSYTTKTLYAEVVFDVSGVLKPAFNNRIQTPYILEVIPGEAYWSKNTSNSNWNDPANWQDQSGVGLKAVPQSCTNVHIPGNAANYPSLDSLKSPRTFFYGEPVCNNITFHFGGEVAKPHYLTYNKAYIQYNFGYYNGGTYKTDGDANYSAIPMVRDRWYALAAPLKNMYAGDFSLGGFPNLWQQGFQTSPGHNSDLVGEWYTPENFNAFDLGANQNYAISLWAAILSSEHGEDNHKNLDALKGIFELPYYENATINAFHPTHIYYPGTKKSRLYYYYSSSPTMELTTQYDEVPRGDNSYRFVFEDTNNKPQAEFKMTVPAKKVIMIGNPFVSSLDFVAFYERNKSSINKFYKLYEKGQFTTYSVTGFPLIAPLQAFFIETTGTGNTVDLYFTKDISVARTGALQLKSSSASEAITGNVLQVKATSSKGESQLAISFSGESGDNIRRMFSGDYNGAVPQVYAVDTKGLKNDVQYEPGYESEIGLGLKCSGTEEVKLHFDTDHFYASSLVLVDNYLNKRHDLYKDNVYSFVNVPEQASDRFTLEVGKSMMPTGLDEIMENVNIRVYMVDNQLNVKASEPISEVQISSIQGVRILSEQSIGNRHFTKTIQTVRGVYIVTVKLENGESKTEKVVVK